MDHLSMLCACVPDGAGWGGLRMLQAPLMLHISSCSDVRATAGCAAMLLARRVCAVQVSRLQRERDEALRAKDHVMVERDVALQQVGASAGGCAGGAAHTTRGCAGGGGHTLAWNIKRFRMSLAGSGAQASCVPRPELCGGCGVSCSPATCCRCLLLCDVAVCCGSLLQNLHSLTNPLEQHSDAHTGTCVRPALVVHMSIGTSPCAQLLGLPVTAAWLSCRCLACRR